MPSLLRMLARWLSIVLMLRTSVVAISFEVCPSAASATTLRSGSAVRRSFSPLRTISWSSATSTRVTVGIGTLVLCLDRDLESDLGTAGGCGFDRDGAADDQRALADAAQAAAL